jgi:DNA polymerase
MTFPNSTADPVALASSVAQWWSLAGLDIAVQDEPRNWLARPVSTPVAPAMPAEVVAAPAPPEPVQQPVSAAMPGDLAGFMTWLANDPGQPEAAFSATRIVPRMTNNPAIAFVTDMPTQGDMAAGELFSGADGRLFDAMLRAVGIDRDQAAFASLLMARPTGGVIDDGLADRVAPRLTHLLQIMRPQAVILLGDRTNRAIGAANGGSGWLPIPALNLDDGSVSALSLPAPFVLLDHPERKAAAWAQLRHLAKR